MIVARSLALLLLASLLGCAGSDLQKALEQPYKQPPYIPDGLERVVIDEQRVRWGVEEKRSFAQVGDSVDLWIRRGDPGSPLGEPVFTGLVPSCYGRARWVTNQQSGQREGACYLRRFTVMDGALLFQLRLGGDWVTAMSVPLSEVYSDDDGDGWSNATERLFGTQIAAADSDGDGQPDPSDPNPLVADFQAIDPSADLEGALVQAALAQTKACQPGKPLFVSGPDRLRRAFAGLSCTVLWRAPNALNTLERSATSGALDTQAQNSRTDKATVDLAAREGGIGRVMVEVDLEDPEKPAVVLEHLLGTERVSFSHADDGWVPHGRKFKMRKTPRAYAPEAD